MRSYVFLNSVEHRPVHHSAAREHGVTPDSQPLAGLSEAKVSTTSGREKSIVGEQLKLAN